MWRFLVIHAICAAIFAREALRSVSARGSVPRSVSTRHCVCVVFLVVMNLSGIGRAVWTFKRLILGSLIADLSGAYSALRDLPYWLAVTLWLYAVVIQSYSVAIVGGLARLRTLARRRFVTMCPLIVLADYLVSYVVVRGRDSDLGNLECYLTLGMLGIVTFGYYAAWQFFRSRECDCLFV